MSRLLLLGTLLVGAVLLGPARASAAEAGASLYQLEGTLTDQQGQRVHLDVFRGAPVLVTMFYGTCPHACPLLISRLHRIEAALSPEARARVRVLLVSLDPERDTPEALAKLAEVQGLDLTRWRLLRAGEPQVHELAAVLGVKFRRLPSGAINHSSVITLLDGAGVVAARMDGLEQPEQALVERLQALAGKGR